MSAGAIRVERGDPRPDELAAVIAVLAALATAPTTAPDRRPPVRPGWVRARPAARYRAAGVWNSP